MYQSKPAQIPFLGILLGGLERHKYYIETLHTLFIETCGIYGACVTQTILMCNNSKLRANYLLKQSEKEKWQKIKSYLLRIIRCSLPPQFRVNNVHHGASTSHLLPVLAPLITYRESLP